MRKEKKVPPALFEATADLKVSNEDNRARAIVNLTIAKQIEKQRGRIPIVVNERTLVTYDPSKTTKEEVIELFN